MCVELDNLAIDRPDSVESTAATKMPALMAAFRPAFVSFPEYRPHDQNQLSVHLLIEKRLLKGMRTEAPTVHVMFASVPTRIR